MTWMLVRAVISAAVIVTVSELSKRSSRLGGLLLTLPIVSILAFAMSWAQHRDLTAIARLARETLVLVPLGLPFFIPLALADQLGVGFWAALAVGALLASLTIGLWLWLGPEL